MTISTGERSTPRSRRPRKLSLEVHTNSVAAAPRANAITQICPRFCRERNESRTRAAKRLYVDPLARAHPLALLIPSVIIGAKTREQLVDNLAAADVKLAPEHVTLLDEASALPLEYPGWMLGFQNREPRGTQEPIKR
jgi:aryl-alcohol dehydrogenase-like predicted oxidoreductase